MTMKQTCLACLSTVGECRLVFLDDVSQRLANVARIHVLEGLQLTGVFSLARVREQVAEQLVNVFLHRRHLVRR